MNNSARMGLGFNPCPITRDVRSAGLLTYTLIEDLGGRVSSSVSKKTDFVIVGKDPGSKYDNALKLGIKTINEDEFKKMVGK